VCICVKAELPVGRQHLPAGSEIEGYGMGLHLAVNAMYVLETMFFIGLVGCGIGIILSWIDILKDGFTDEPAPKN
jgi:hypothetical protein